MRQEDADSNRVRSPRRTRRSARARVDGVSSSGPSQPAPSRHRLPFAPTELLAGEQIEAIHDASLEVLRDIGLDVLNQDARSRLASAGAQVTGSRVRFDPNLVVELVNSAPSEFELHAVNPSNNVPIGGDNVVFTSVGSAPFVSDINGGRRTGNQNDFRRLVQLSHHLNAVQVHAGYPVEPTDIHPSVRHLHATRDLLTLSDKPIHGYSLGAQRNRDVLEMVRIMRGVDHDGLDRQPSVFTVINVSSPLRLDDPMCQGIIEFSSRNQVVVATPFTLAGAMAPVTVAGALVQQNAEALATIALTQVVRAGSPVVYGGFTSSVDMRSGSPAFGTPEYVQSAIVGGQLARRYGLPYRSSNVNAANAVDAQAGYESVFSLWGAIMGGANLVFHGAGWLEGGLTASYEKMVLDADLIQMVATFLTPVNTDQAGLAVDAITEVGPGGHFFGAAHTRERYRTAFHSPMVSDWRNYEAWTEAGRPTADLKAADLVERLLADYTAPDLNPNRVAELDEFVVRRVSEGGVATDY